MTLSAPAVLLLGRETAVDVAWRTPARDLWVGSTDDGRYLGMVELRDERYLATDWASRQVGEYLTLADAQAELDTTTGAAVGSDREGRISALTAAVAAGAGVAAIALASAVALVLPH